MPPIRPWPGERIHPCGPALGWQADITSVATKEGWLYVAGGLDACRRQIVGWAAADAMPTRLVARAFERAVEAERPRAGCSTIRFTAASTPATPAASGCAATAWWPA